MSWGQFQQPYFYQLLHSQQKYDWDYSFSFHGPSFVSRIVSEKLIENNEEEIDDNHLVEE